MTRITKMKMEEMDMDSSSGSGHLRAAFQQQFHQGDQ